MKRIFLLVLVFIAFCGKAVCEDIAYVVTQDSNLRPPNSLVGSAGTVKKGDIVYFQGKIDKQVHSFDFLVRTEKGQEGCIDEKYILLRDSKSLPNAITGKTWIVSYYQQFLQGVKKKNCLIMNRFGVMYLMKSIAICQNRRNGGRKSFLWVLI